MPNVTSLQLQVGALSTQLTLANQKVVALTSQLTAANNRVAAQSEQINTLAGQYNALAAKVNHPTTPGGYVLDAVDLATVDGVLTVKP